MSADIKWEAVETIGDLKAGDNVRLVHGNGDVLHGKVTDEGIYALPICTTPTIWQECGYTVERAVPERTLPTEPGLYQGSSAIDLSGTENATTYRLRWDNTWVNMAHPDMETSADYLPDDLVRLVPVTDVEAAEKRGIRKVHERYVSMRNTCTAVEISSAFPDAFTKEA